MFTLTVYAFMYQIYYIKAVYCCFFFLYFLFRFNCFGSVLKLTFIFSTDRSNGKLECEEILIEIVEDSPEACENEPKQFVLEPNLELEDSARKSRPCNACGKPFKDLGRHLESHGYDNCLECLLHFPDKKSLGDHLEFVHQVTPECHYCGVCDASFSSVAILAVHNAKHTGRFECPVCNFVVKGRYRHSLINHIKRHEGKYEVQCKLCGQGFFSKTSLSSHLEMHEGIPKYKCEYCDKRFTVKR